MLKKKEPYLLKNLSSTWPPVYIHCDLCGYKENNSHRVLLSIVDSFNRTSFETFNIQSITRYYKKHTWEAYMFQGLKDVTVWNPACEISGLVELPRECVPPFTWVCCVRGTILIVLLFLIILRRTKSTGQFLSLIFEIFLEWYFIALW